MKIKHKLLAKHGSSVYGIFYILQVNVVLQMQEIAYSKISFQCLR